MHNSGLASTLSLSLSLSLKAEGLKGLFGWSMEENMPETQSHPIVCNH